MDGSQRHLKSADAPDALPLGTATHRAVTVIDATGRLGQPAITWLEDRAAAALSHLDVGADLRVRIVGDPEMATAHAEYCGVEGTTDVLTFDLSEPHAPDARPALDVDILACYDEAARQAGPRAIPPQRELLLYVVHGLMHCLGHDDHDQGAALAMHAAEDRVLEAIGVGPTYAAPARPGGDA